MLKNNKLLIAKNDEKELCILPRMANRHGIITGASGSGKTTTVKVMAESFSAAGIPVFYVDVKGDLATICKEGTPSESIDQRIKNLKLDDKCVLHLDLYDTDKITLMMEFLFSLLITRFYGENEDIFYLSKNIEIKVETPNSFIDFFEKFPILTLFKVRELKISDLAPLIVPDDIESNVEIVANYLKALKEDKINKYDLILYPGAKILSCFILLKSDKK